MYVIEIIAANGERRQRYASDVETGKIRLGLREKPLLDASCEGEFFFDLLFFDLRLVQPRILNCHGGLARDS